MASKKSAPRVNKTQAFEIVRVKRSSFTQHPRNPRQITKTAKKKLGAGIKKFGLLQPIIVNKRTNRILGGHQRIDACDAIEEGDYLLDVSMVDVPEKDEGKILVLLNNDQVGGTWDNDALASLLQDCTPQEVESTGFDQVSLELLLGQTGVGLFGGEDDTPEAKQAMQDVAEVEATRQEEIAAAKGRRQALREVAKQESAETDTERYVVVAFPTRELREKWVEYIGLPPTQKHVPYTAVVDEAFSKSVATRPKPKRTPK